MVGAKKLAYYSVIHLKNFRMTLVLRDVTSTVASTADGVSCSIDFGVSIDFFATGLLFALYYRQVFCQRAVLNWLPVQMLHL